MKKTVFSFCLIISLITIESCFSQKPAPKDQQAQDDNNEIPALLPVSSSSSLTSHLVQPQSSSASSSSSTPSSTQSNDQDNPDAKNRWDVKKINAGIFHDTPSNFPQVCQRYANSVTNPDQEAFWNNPDNFLTFLNTAFAQNKIKFTDEFTCKGEHKELSALFWVARTAHPIWKKIFSKQFLVTLNIKYKLPLAEHFTQMLMIRDEKDNNLLHYGVLSKDLALVKRLASLLYDINGCSELYRAAKDRNLPQVTTLLTKVKVHPDGCANKAGVTPLRLAHTTGTTEIATFLKGEKAELNSPIIFCASHHAIAELFKQHGASEKVSE